VVIYRKQPQPKAVCFILCFECPLEGDMSEGGIVEDGIAGCGISLQYHPLFCWAGLRKVREKYHIYIYKWNCRIIKEICIKYNIDFYLILSMYSIEIHLFC
jgi:hypothetical protein